MKPVYMVARMYYNASMIIVFWRQSVVNPAGALEWVAQHNEFDTHELTLALARCEGLRSAGPHISHVCIQSEIPTSVGKPGVSDPKDDYDWYKRRIDPSIQLGRERT